MTRLIAVLALTLSFGLLVTGCDQRPGDSEGESASAAKTPQTSTKSPATAKGAKIDFDDIVPAGQIPPPEVPVADELAKEFGDDIRKVMKLQATSRCVFGTLGGDADFQVCLPVEGWNGKLVVHTPGAGGDEIVRGSYSTRLPALNQGYAFASTDRGYDVRFFELAEPQNRGSEGERRTLQLTKYARGLTGSYYEKGPAYRTYIVGKSLGGYFASRLLERYPSVYDGGIRFTGLNSPWEAIRAYAIWLRNFDKDPVSDLMYDTGAQLANGFTYRLGQERGTESLWPSPLWGYLLARAIPGLDPNYDPDGDGTLSSEEIKAWDADERPKHVRAQAKKILDLNGRLDRKMIAWSGTNDLVSPPSIEREYQRLVEETRGSGQVQLYLESGADHFPFPVLLGEDGTPVGFLPEALRAIDEWVGEGTQPGSIGDLQPE